MTPMVAFGKGFVSSRVKSTGAPVYPVDVSNGMPIVVHKKRGIPNRKIKICASNHKK